MNKIKLNGTGAFLCYLNFGTTKNEFSWQESTSRPDSLLSLIGNKGMIVVNNIVYKDQDTIPDILPKQPSFK